MRARLLLAWVLLLGACYRPKIPDGSFKCGPGGLCPEGYVCNSLMVCASKNGGGNDLSGGNGGSLFTGKVGPLELAGQDGILRCSTKTGEIILEDPVGMGSRSLFPQGVDGFAVLPQASGPSVAIWSFTLVDIPAGITVRPNPDSDAIPVFATVGDLTMAGTMDWRTYGGFGNIGGKAGTGKLSGVDSGGGGGTGTGGGGGGGHSDVGGMGSGTGGGTGGAAYGTDNLMPVHTGSGGGGGGSMSGGNGGNGGGSIVLIAAGKLSISGKIDVSGNTGFPGTPGLNGGSGGGGSGGSILLSGTTVQLDAGHELVARGGKGGAAMAPGAAGGDGAPGRIWIGGQLSASGGVVADPTAKMETTAITTFPAQ